MISFEQVERKIQKKLKGQLPPNLVLDADTQLDDLGLSSLQLAEIVFELEEENGVEFDPAQAADVKTLGGLIDLGNRMIAGEGARIVGSDVGQ